MLWDMFLFAVAMEVIVIGTFFGGTFLAYRIGTRQSTKRPSVDKIATDIRRAHALDASTETDEHTSVAA
jgi:uncharacterized protein YneF (UPF0154 family)